MFILTMQCMARKNLDCHLEGDDMAALDGKITIGIEYRPCVVYFPEIKRKAGKTELLIQKEEKHKALFHCWNHRSELYDASPMIGGHPGGHVSGTFAIVEYEDGTVHEVEPQKIRFVDNTVCEYAFSGNGGEIR